MELGGAPDIGPLRQAVSGNATDIVHKTDNCSTFKRQPPILATRFCEVVLEAPSFLSWPGPLRGK